MPDVAGPGLAVLRRNAAPHQPDNEPGQSVYGHALATADVVDAGGIAVAGQDVGIDHIPDEGEVPRLLAIVVDDGRPVIERCPDEQGDDRGVLGIRVLPRSVDIEVPEADGGESVHPVEHLTVVFAGQLGYSIRRLGVGEHLLRFGQSGRIAVDRR